jgi:hypothetical protein
MDYRCSKKCLTNPWCSVLIVSSAFSSMQRGASSSDRDSDCSSDASDGEFEAMDLPHIPGAAADVVAAAAAAGLIDCMQFDATHRADVAPCATFAAGASEAGSAVAVCEKTDAMDESGNDSDSSSGSSSSSSSSSESDAMDNSAAVAAMLEVDSDDEVFTEPVVAAAQVTICCHHRLFH